MPAYEIKEDPEYTAQLAVIGNVGRLDDRLAGLHIALWSDPESFPRISPGHSLRVATVLSFQDSEPDLTVWFEIDEGNVVLLRWIEPAPDSPKTA